MWPKFGNSSVSMKKSYHNLSFIRIWPEKRLFWGVLLVQAQQFGTGTRNKLDILH